MTYRKQLHRAYEYSLPRLLWSESRFSFKSGCGFHRQAKIFTVGLLCKAPSQYEVRVWLRVSMAHELCSLRD